MSAGKPLEQNVIVSLRELVVLIRRVLFSLHIPSHATLSASRVIAQLELREGTGLAYLEELVSLRLPWRIRQRGIQIVRDATVIDADSDDVLLLGPPMMDVACAKAKRHGKGIVLAQSVGTLPFAMVLDELSVRRGFSTLIVMTRPGVLRSVIEGNVDIGSPVEGLYLENDVIFGVVCSSDCVAEVAIRRNIEPLDLTALIRDWTRSPEPGLELRSLTRRPTLTERGDLLVVCHQQCHPLVEGDSTDWEDKRGYEWISFDSPAYGSATWWERQAIIEGVRVNELLWGRLEEEVFRGLAPKSPRSRLDAGATDGDLS